MFYVKEQLNDAMEVSIEINDEKQTRPASKKCGTRLKKKV